MLLLFRQRRIFFARNLNMFVKFQCGFPFVRPGDELLHIFSHHIECTEDDLREILRDFVLQNIDWFTNITSIVREYSNLTVEDYIDNLTTPGVPLDFVGITVLSRIYHIHVGVFFKNGAWGTSKHKNFESARFGLVYNGNLKFTETVRTGWGEQYLTYIEGRLAQGKMPSHERTVMPGLALKPELNEQIAETDTTKQCVPAVPDVKLKVERGTVQKKVHAVKQTLIAKLKRDLQPTVSQPSTSAQPTQSATFTSTVPKPGRKIGGDRLKGPQDCPCCNSTKQSQSALNKHIASYHPEYQFPCEVCGRKYTSYNSWYKHKIEHTAPTLFCGICFQGFHFEAQLNRHMNSHEDVKPFGCDMCEKRFTQNKSLTRHKKVHLGGTVTCTMCDKTCTTPEQLYTHFRGAHGKGYTAPCGDHFQWPGPRAKHQADCTSCKHKIELRKMKRKYPLPYKKEPTTTVKQEHRYD